MVFDQVPQVTVQRRINLLRLAGARKALNDRPSWTAIFLKAYGILAQEVPELRRAYVKLPWPQLYEYPESVAAVAHEREFRGEPAVFLGRIKAPARRSISELTTFVREAQSKPIAEIRDFSRALQMAKWPVPIRRLLMWLGLNLGRHRALYFGTFHLSVYSGLGS